jgi:O-antigen/teichoic acid export membrane protein
MIFSKDFSEIKMVLWYIAPGIMFLAIQTILSSYFSSVHKVYVNALGSLAGLLVIGALVWPLTMLMDLNGSAIANVASYLISLIVAIGFYLFVEKIPIRSILINTEDLKKYLKVFKVYK